MDYFAKVGLTMGDTEVPLPSILFKDNKSPFLFQILIEWYS